jgi:hypothetical protein
VVQYAPLPPGPHLIEQCACVTFNYLSSWISGIDSFYFRFTQFLSFSIVMSTHWVGFSVVLSVSTAQSMDIVQNIIFECLVRIILTEPRLLQYKLLNYVVKYAFFHKEIMTVPALSQRYSFSSKHEALNSWSMQYGMPMRCSQTKWDQCDFDRCFRKSHPNK